MIEFPLQIGPSMLVTEAGDQEEMTQQQRTFSV